MKQAITARINTCNPSPKDKAGCHLTITLAQKHVRVSSLPRRAASKNPRQESAVCRTHLESVIPSARTALASLIARALSNFTSTFPFLLCVKKQKASLPNYKPTIFEKPHNNFIARRTATITGPELLYPIEKGHQSRHERASRVTIDYCSIHSTRTAKRKNTGARSLLNVR